MKNIWLTANGTLGYLGLLFLGGGIAMLLLLIAKVENIRIASIFSALFALGLVFFWLIRKKRDIREALSLYPVSAKVLLLSIAATLGVTLLIESLPMLMPQRWIAAVPDEVYTDSLVLDILSIVCISPVVEEIFFRALIMPSLTNNLSPNASIAITSTIFAIMHQGVVWMILAFCMSLWFCAVYIKTTSIIPCVLAHIVSNLTAVVLHFIFLRG